MKKMVSLLIALTMVFGVVSFAKNMEMGSGMRIVTREDKAFNDMSDDVREQVMELMNQGITVYYGAGTTSPDYLNSATLARNIPTAITNLPASAALFDYDMVYGNVYYSPSLLRATQACTMKIYRTCTIDENPHSINLKVVDKTAGNTIFDNDVTVDYPGTTLSIRLEAGHDYYIITTPLATGTSKIAYVISGV